MLLIIETNLTFWVTDTLWFLFSSLSPVLVLTISRFGWMAWRLIKRIQPFCDKIEIKTLYVFQRGILEDSRSSIRKTTNVIEAWQFKNLQQLSMSKSSVDSLRSWTAMGWSAWRTSYGVLWPVQTARRSHKSRRQPWWECPVILTLTPVILKQTCVLLRKRARACRVMGWNQVVNEWVH